MSEPPLDGPSTHEIVILPRTSLSFLVITGASGTIYSVVEMGSDSAESPSLFVIINLTIVSSDNSRLNGVARKVEIKIVQLVSDVLVHSIILKSSFLFFAKTL